ncbi:hypothetical protein BDY24DRAFT_195148 [Mrakia frigida]|uniref:uncharacterized protein n=1 Tax=Mrakia frigida TaxID=29902 RepID=UPI003FCBFE60
MTSNHFQRLHASFPLSSSSAERPSLQLQLLLVSYLPIGLSTLAPSCLRGRMDTLEASRSRRKEMRWRLVRPFFSSSSPFPGIFRPSLDSAISYQSLLRVWGMDGSCEGGGDWPKRREGEGLIVDPFLLLVSILSHPLDLTSLNQVVTPLCRPAFRPS